MASGLEVQDGIHRRVSQGLVLGPTIVLPMGVCDQCPLYAGDFKKATVDLEENIEAIKAWPLKAKTSIVTD